MSWRDVLKIHPAAELFPMMAPDELKALGEDIKANGLRHELVFYEDDRLLDGRNRLDAMEAVGLPVIVDDQLNEDVVRGAHTVFVDPYAFVVSTNLHRRHLTAAQKNEVIAALLKAKPERSDRATRKLPRSITRPCRRNERSLRQLGKFLSWINAPASTARRDRNRRPRARSRSTIRHDRVIA